MDGDFEDADVPDCDVSFEARSMPGTCDPIGFFDPVGFTKNASEGRIRFYREVEVGLAKEPTPSLALPAQPWQHLLTRPCAVTRVAAAQTWTHFQYVCSHSMRFLSHAAHATMRHFSCSPLTCARVWHLRSHPPPIATPDGS